MEISLYCDFSYRTLLYLGLQKNKLSRISDISTAYEISVNHLVKVVHNLVKLGYVESVRGRNGGIRLAKSPSEINLGELFKLTEPNKNLVECFDSKTNHCPIIKTCELKSVLHQAFTLFVDCLSQYTLEDLLQPKSGLRKTLGISAAALKKK